MKMGFLIMLGAFMAKCWQKWNIGNNYYRSEKGVERFRGIANRKRGKYKRR